MTRKKTSDLSMVEMYEQMEAICTIVQQSQVEIHDDINELKKIISEIKNVAVMIRASFQMREKIFRVEELGELLKALSEEYSRTRTVVDRLQDIAIILDSASWPIENCNKEKK